MFSGIIIIVFCLLVLCIYLTICSVTDIFKVISVRPRTNRRALEDYRVKCRANAISWFNSFIYGVIARKTGKLGRFALLKAKKTDVILAGINTTMSLLLMTVLIMVTTFSNTFAMLSGSLTNILNLTDCKCYVHCSGNAGDDSKTAYELLFGPKKWAEFEGAFKGALGQASIEEYESLTTVKAKSSFIIQNLGVTALKEYRDTCVETGFYEPWDGKKRASMEDNELMADLKALFADHKTEGRNKNCEACDDLNNQRLKDGCYGAHAYVADWTWTEQWQAQAMYNMFGDDKKPESGTVVGYTKGHATGQYAVSLSDGTSWYWYHQSGHGCANNPIDPDFGDTAKLMLGNPDSKSYGTMASRGCSIYASACAISNVLGKEITPGNVIKDVLGCSIQVDDSGRTYVRPESSSGISADGSITVDKAALAGRMVLAYGQYGLRAEAIGKLEGSQDKLDSILANNGVYILSVKQGSPFYGGTGSHFIIIRDKDESGLYKCITSANPSFGTGHDGCIQTANEAVATWEQLVAGANNGGSGIGVWAPPSKPVEQPQGGCIVNVNGYSYYWYHQTSEQCEYNVYDATYGYFGDALTAGGSKVSAVGCPLYAMAICTSNLLNQNVSPFKLADAMGTSWVKDGNNYRLNACASYGKSGIVASQAASALNSYYASQGLHVESGQLTQSYVDSILDKGGMVHFRTKGSWEWHAKNNPSNNTEHSMVIVRKDDAGLYYCLTSTDNDSCTNYATTGVTFDKILSHAPKTWVQGFWSDTVRAGNASSSGGSGAGSIAGITGGTMVMPAIGEQMTGLEINTQKRYTLPRYKRDTFAMESTVKKMASLSSKVTNRIETLRSMCSSTTYGVKGTLLTYNIGGKELYAAAIQDGFGVPMGVYDVYLDNGTVFSIVIVDVKSSADAPGKGASKQCNTAYGHAYLVSGYKEIQLSAVEFMDANTASNSLFSDSAASYSNGSMLSGRYVTKIVRTGTVQ